MTVVNNTIVEVSPGDPYSEYDYSPMLSEGFVQGANLSFNKFYSHASPAALAAGKQSILPVGISVWGNIHDRFTPSAFYVSSVASAASPFQFSPPLLRPADCD